VNESTLRTRRRASLFAWLKFSSSAFLLFGVLWALGAEGLLTRVTRLSPGFVVLAIAATSLQFLLLSARWAWFARELGVRLAYRHALGEYYLSALLNQVLPFGVLGDALRVVRHSEQVHRHGASPLATPRVLLAAALDRISGQTVVALVAVAAAPRLLQRASAALASPLLTLTVAAGVGLGGALTLALVLKRRLAPVRDLLGDGFRALLLPRSLLLHLPMSCALLLLSGVQFWACARSLGLSLSPWAAAQIVPAVLLAAALPAFFSGWGVREVAAAALYHLSGMQAADGAAVSVVFGLVSLISSLPGARGLWGRDWLRGSENPK
jgi:glycosyltransferase 2 family protein